MLADVIITLLISLDVILLVRTIRGQSERGDALFCLTTRLGRNPLQIRSAVQELPVATA
jgi:hypothetical protein